MTVKFDERGLICAIAQDYASGDVLMQAYMSRRMHSPSQSRR